MAAFVDIQKNVTGTLCVLGLEIVKWNYSLINFMYCLSVGYDKGTYCNFQDNQKRMQRGISQNSAEVI